MTQSDNGQIEQSWIDLLCREWRRTQSSLLSLVIKHGRLLASEPPKLRVLSGLQSGRDDDLLNWVTEMTESFNESRIMKMTAEELEASLQVLLHHRRWDDLVDVSGRMYAIISLEFWKDYVGKVGDEAPQVLWRCSQVAAPRLSLVCLHKLRETGWKPANAIEMDFLEGLIEKLPTEIPSLYNLNLATPSVVAANQSISQSFTATDYKISAQNVVLKSGDFLIWQMRLHMNFSAVGKNKKFSQYFNLDCGPIHGAVSIETPALTNWDIQYLQKFNLFEEMGQVSYHAFFKRLDNGNSFHSDGVMIQATTTILPAVMSCIPPHRVTKEQIFELEEAAIAIRANFPTDTAASFVLNMILWSRHLPAIDSISPPQQSRTGRFAIVDAEQEAMPGETREEC